MEARSPKEVLLTGGTGFIGSRITAELKTMKKSNSMTYKKQRTKIKFIFESTIPQKNFYIRNAHSNIQKLTRLFSVSPSFVVVHVFRNRASFLKAIHKKKVPDWLVALVPPKNTSRIYVFDNKERIASKKLLGQVILHEITHLYTNALNPNLPDWLSEGIAVYVAAQIFKPSISTADWKKITQEGAPFKRVSWRIAAEHNGYSIAGLLVMFFVRRYGWEKFIAAISHRHSRRISIKSIPLYFDEKFERFIADFKKQFVK
ncbi:MAG: hypothetical protein UW81_C0023G0004 [Candidatus Giovannonibacteria bacterium GW2011_GWC2_44_9]|uniref:Peptidase MA-like domain-containing protein n=3 Tax=Candidatus Giovannoniibacteriota TaxID=1752738 RepID=A0A0G1IVB5_9BACT|nr:MAG: hypothetical protein UW49_C0006G0004 [Candidatus Giovannonibacteria bacterium GW2011_GWB1_44_23]KKT63336.1 MAG: hypothetical protein UW57_C0008G0004 [Candidatus Giovannonibacteria bacterium GW2011_GWA1_44_29]KKT83226.1 MAG: hypothetical protein UW81_C0023G0004 [Candidatus Giovannonibacteria bacterium GW2011_GWC2_44_9]KKT91540.1 MAG: hypothetical protein UW93_C0005G0004 [Parcubacteria group bacterium GW2011_GWC1_45_13]